MGRKAKNRIKKHVSHDPQFIVDIEAQALDGESFGETVERLLAEKSAMILELETRLEKTSHGMKEKGTSEAIRRVSLSLQAWFLTPQDTIAREAFENALSKLFKPSP
jgi:hypothetical protein